MTIFILWIVMTTTPQQPPKFVPCKTCFQPVFRHREGGRK